MNETRSTSACSASGAPTSGPAPEHEVGDAGGHARLRQRPHEHDRGGRGQLARLEHEGVARGQRGSDLPRRLQQRVVPRRDQSAHADGLPHDPADRVVPAGVDDPPGIGAGHSAEVAEAGDDVVDVVLGLDQSLAGVQRLGPRHLLLVPLEEVGHAEQQRAALPGRRRGPGAVVEGGPRGRDRRGRVGGARLVHGGDRAPVRGAGDVAAPARGGRHPSPGDEQIRHGTSRSAWPVRVLLAATLLHAQLVLLCATVWLGLGRRQSLCGGAPSRREISSAARHTACATLGTRSGVSRKVGPEALSAETTSPSML